MKPVVPPIRLGQSGEPIANLQDALSLLLGKSLLHIPDGQRALLDDGLNRERTTALYGDITAKFVVAVQTQTGLPATDEIDGPTADALNRMLEGAHAFDALQPAAAESFVVRGRATSNGMPVSRLSVIAADLDVRGSQSLFLAASASTTKTDTDGNYRIAYDAAMFNRAEKDSADLVFTLRSASGEAISRFIATDQDGRPLATVEINTTAASGPSTVSVPIVPNAPPDATVNFDIAIGAIAMPSEYERLLAMLDPLLINVLPPNNANPTLLQRIADLNAQDIDFLALETSVDRRSLEQLVAAVRLAHDPFADALSASILYGLARTLAATDVPMLARQSVAVLRGALLQTGGFPGQPGDNTIPEFGSEIELNRAADTVHSQANRLALTTASGAAKAPLSSVLKAALPAPEQQLTLVSTFANHVGPVPQFWQDLRRQPAFQAPGVIERTQFALQVGAFADSRPSLVAQIQGTDQYRSMRDLALDTAALPAFTKQMPSEELADQPGLTVDDKAAHYARQLQSKLQFAFPTETVALAIGRLAGSTGDAQKLQPVAHFLLKASDPSGFPEGEAFNLRSTHIDTFVARHGDKLLDGTSASQKREVIAGAKRMQRIFNMSSDSEAFNELMKRGVVSAQQIAAMPKTAFVHRFKGALGGAAADYIHGKAMAIGLAATELAVRVYQARNDAHPAVTGDGIKELPRWAELFGSAELCECAHCGSVLGPAAYFVDLLQFLRHSKPNAAGFTPLDVLIGIEGQPLPAGRRPDLAYLQLSCENTDTVLPYVDLVNEVLESYIVQGGHATRDAAHDVGERSTAELLANPQFVKQQAYDLLAAAVYPPGLPFDRSLTASRQYLAALQTSRTELLRAFAPEGPHAWSPAIVAERLGLAAKDYEIVTGRLLDGGNSSIEVKRLYGFDPAAEPLPLGQLVRRQSVRDLLRRTALAFTELLDILGTFFVNPAHLQLRTIEKIGLTDAEIKTIVDSNFTTIPASAQQKLDAASHSVADLRTWLGALNGLAVLLSNGSACDLDETFLQGKDGAALDDAFFRRLQCFVRLWRALGWTVGELDSALRARSFDADAVVGLRDLAQIVELAERTGMAKSALLALWAPLESHGKESLYRQLFESRALSTSPDTRLALNATEDELAAAQHPNPPKLADVHAPVLAAMRLREAEFALIAAAAALPADAPLNLANLSTIHRYSALSRGAGIPLRLLIELGRLAPASPFASPLGTLAFIDLATRIDARGISQPQLAFLCRHADADGQIGAALQRRAAALNARLLAGLQKLDDDAKLMLAPTTEQLHNELALLIHVPANLDRAVDIVEGRSAASDADKQAFMTAQFTPFLGADVQSELLANVSVDPANPDGAQLAEEQRIERRGKVLQALVASLKRDLVRQAVADSAEVPEGLQPLLLANAAVLHATGDSSRPLLDDFMNPGPTLDEPLPSAFVRLQKAMNLIAWFEIGAEELAHVAAHPTDFAGFDLNKLPLSAANGSGVFASVDALAAYAELRDSAGAGGQRLIDCCAAADPAARRAAIATWLGIDKALVQDALLKLALPDSTLRRTAGLRAVARLVGVSRGVGAMPSRMAAWSGAPTPAIADELRDTLKAKYDAQSWLSAARSVSDPLREAQRAALVAYVMAMPPIVALGFRSPDQLFDYFLIDVQMAPCMLTSRVKQAISSIQIFVDRCLLNLEQSISPDAIDREQWLWRKNYRVWEANRKVFLYPENWIEPELRDDKSPFFKELESELQQTDVTDDSAQTALGSYLAKLDEVARLEVCGTYLETGFDDPARSVLHVIARNLTGAPRKYFYRRLVDDITSTGWEKVDLEIQGTEDRDHSGTQVLPVVWRQRLYLFWLGFTKKADPPLLLPIQIPGSIDPSQQVPTPYWEIKLNWSLYENGRWMQKRLSNVTVDFPSLQPTSGDFQMQARLISTVGGSQIITLSTHEKTDPGSVSRFKLKALASDESLDLVVVRDSTTRVGMFSLHDRHGGVTSAAVSGAEQEVLPEQGAALFMASRTAAPLSLVMPQSASAPDRTSVAILQTQPRPVRVLSANQFSPASLETPHFIELPSASYFVRSRPVSVWVADYHSYPTQTIPGDVQTSVFSMGSASGSSPQTLGGFASVRSAHPWTMASAALLSATANGSMAQGDASAVDPFNGGFVVGTTGGGTYSSFKSEVDLQFNTAFHPYANEFVRRLGYQGIAGLLSLDTQSLGNAYLREPWRPGYKIDVSSDDPASLIESSFGRSAATGQAGNLELVVRERPDGANPPALGPRKLAHYSHPSANPADAWQRVAQITELAIAGGCLIERVSGGSIAPGTFELVVPQTDGLVHYSRSSSAPFAWHANDPVPATTSEPVCLIESDYKSTGADGTEFTSLELFVVEPAPQAGKRQLKHYRLIAGPQHAVWQPEGIVAADVSGPACAIQSSFKYAEHGRFEVLVLEPNPLSRTTQRLLHYWKDESVSDWQRGLVITDEATGPGWLIESEVRDCANHGNFEVAVREGAQLVHCWRDNSTLEQFWRRGQVIATTASAAGCLIQSHTAALGSFQAVVPEGGVLKHYFHVNAGPAGSTAERFYFGRQYTPTARVQHPYPRHDVDFSFGGSYAPYNWELFFHAPMAIATRLFRNQRYAEALKWLHYIFDPTIDSQELTSQRFWRCLPLRDNDKTNIAQMLAVLSGKRPEDAARRAEVEAQIRDWQRHPFQPHRIARMRLGAYKKNVVMKYLDNIIAWGDKLFRQDTIESINEATQLYVLAANLLGPRPDTVPERSKRVPLTYRDLATSPDGLDAFANALVEVENEFPYSSTLPPVDGSSEAAGLLGMASVLYFCIPKNDKLLGYWDTVEDRLFKVRLCMNIQGVVRQLPLFEPPIDPAMLVQGAAQGLPLSSMLADLSAPLPYYRFSYTFQKAVEMCADLKSLGAQLLAALEKKDAEALAAMRAGQETALYRLVKQVRDLQFEEAYASVNAILASRNVTLARYQHYRVLLGVDKAPAEPKEGDSIDDFTPSKTAELKTNDDTGVKLIGQEGDELAFLESAHDWQTLGSASDLLASTHAMLPNFEYATKPYGVGTSLSMGSQQVTNSYAAWGRVMQWYSAMDSYDASRSSKFAAFIRREQDWALQFNSAARELMQIDKQLVAARKRVDIASKEQSNQQTQIDNAENIEFFLKSKLSNADLYSWIQGEVGNLYAQAYELAYDAAKRAEQCYRFERGVKTSNFIQFGAWDGINRNLLAGERLHFALRQMERAYQEQNKRPYELTRHVSLLSLDPMALVRLKETGSCEIDLPEALFDLDFPGHYFRCLTAISLTVPCVLGPYENMCCTLRLLRHETRIDSSPQPYLNQGESDQRFLVNFASTHAIATSSGQNDSGLFELNFRDERYLPFEGAGAVSRWLLTLSSPFQRFDHDSITDVIMHVRYTAREGGDRLRGAAVKALKDALKQLDASGQGPLTRLFSLRHEFPSEWQRLWAAPAPGEPTPVVRGIILPIAKDRFPFYTASASMQPTLITAIAVAKPGATPAGFTMSFVAARGSGNEVGFDVALQSRPDFPSVLKGDSGSAALPKIDADPGKDNWEVGLSLAAGEFTQLREGLRDVLLILSFTATFGN